MEEIEVDRKAVESLETRLAVLRIAFARPSGTHAPAVAPYRPW
jgi:hypothetical protein